MSAYDETVFEIWRMMEKRNYYLMGAAGAGIGYTLTTLPPDSNIFQTRLIMGSLLCWTISFASGHLAAANLQTIVLGFAATPTLLAKAKSEGHAASESLIAAMTALSADHKKRNKRFASIQVWSLFLAAGLLVSTKLDLGKALGLTP